MPEGGKKLAFLSRLRWRSRSLARSVRARTSGSNGWAPPPPLAEGRHDSHSTGWGAPAPPRHMLGPCTSLASSSSSSTLTVPILEPSTRDANGGSNANEGRL